MNVMWIPVRMLALLAVLLLGAAVPASAQTPGTGGTRARATFAGGCFW
jgi:hypothetical protein